jgi:hypothetical protein
MSILTVNAIDKAGVDIRTTNVAADVAGDQVPASSGLLFSLDNGGGAPIELTVAAPVSESNCGGFGGLPVADLTISLAAGVATEFVIPLGYTDSSGNFAWTYDDVTSVTVGVYSLNPNG